MTQVDLGLTARISGEEDVFLSGVRDISILAGPSGPVIYTATGGGGAGMASFALSDGLVQRLDFAVFPGGAQVGLSPSITPLDLDGALVIAATGINDAGLWAYNTTASGALSDTGAVPSATALPPDLSLIHTQDIAGASYVFGARSGAGTIDVWQVSGAGQIALQHSVATSAPDITGLAGLRYGGQDFLLSISGMSGTVTSYQLDSTGLPVRVDSTGAADGLGIGAASALQVARIGGQAYAIVAGRDSSSLSVIEIGPTGALRAADHLLDSPQTRFGGVDQLHVTNVDGFTYVLASGNEDGISLFQLLPGGRAAAASFNTGRQPDQHIGRYLGPGPDKRHKWIADRRRQRNRAGPDSD